ncbi:hypothetical protein LMG26296_05338 [Cupriavidus plantarum]|nr:hypothetical protein LMG26296_05338 [Cupriavidus plantarum]
MRQAPLGLQSLDQLLERQLLMRLRLLHGLAGLAQQREHGPGAIDPRPQHLRVHEEANGTGRLRAVAVGDRHADADVVLPGVAVEQDLERCEQHRKGSRTGPLSQASQLQRLVTPKRKRHGATAVRRHGRPRTVRRQLEHHGVVAKRATPVVELPLALSRLEPVTLPRSIVRILRLNRQQPHRLPGSVSRIKRSKLVDDDAHRPSIGDDMVHRDEQHMIVRRQPQQPHPHQRPMREIERRSGLGIHVPRQRRLGNVDERNRYRKGRMNALHRLPIAFMKRRAQTLVPRDQRIESRLQRRDVQRSP